MEYWASLEHELVHKLGDKKAEAVVQELKDTANMIAQTDIRMQRLHHMT